MIDKTIHIPDMSSASKTDNYIPIDKNGGAMPVKKRSGVKLMVVIVFLLIGLGITFWVLQTTLLSQSGESASPPPACHNGSPPLPIDPLCGTLGNPQPCPAPREGYCKEKGACFECRYRHFGLRMICQCPAPTSPPQASPPTVVKPTEIERPLPTVTDVPTPTVEEEPTPPDSCPLPEVNVEVECIGCKGP